MHTTNFCAWCSKIQVDDGLIELREFPSPNGRGKLKPNVAEHESGTWVYPVDLVIYDFFPALPNLTEASLSGCPFGGFLKNVLESADVEYQLSDDIIDFEGRFIPFKLVFAYAWGAFKVSTGDSGLEALRITIYLDTVEGSPRDKEPPFHIICRVHKTSYDFMCCDWLGIERPFPESKLWDEQSVDWVKYQLAECDEKRGPHLSHCGLNYTKRFIPGRLVDLHSNILQVVDRAGILASMSEGECPPRYTALSYCWGLPVDSNHQLRLLKSSLTEKRFAFTSLDLPVVVQDAIVVTRSLSIRYLWVDALCILQDDQSDWETESRQMDQIYGGSYITICSLTASCHLTFLDRDMLTTTIDFQSAVKPDIQGKYGITYDYCVGLRSGAGIVMDRLLENRWSRRGWTFQEAILSPRLLFFEQLDISFACSNRIAYRSGNTGEHPYESLQMLQHHVRNHHESAWALWYEWVLSRYCDRTFTQPLDVFPAISGVAQTFSKMIGANYHAGLWDTDLTTGLLWEVDAESQRADLSGLINLKQPTSLTGLLTMLSSGPYVSPSWSWAGRQAWVNNSIVCYSHIWTNVRDECDIAASTSASGSNPFGRVMDAWIRFTGITFAIGPGTPMVPSGSFPGHYKIALTGGGSVTCRFDWPIYDTYLQGEFKMILLGSFFEESEANDNASDVSQSGPENEANRTAFGLIIHRALKSNSFFRVGVFFSLVSRGGGLRYFRVYRDETLKII